MTDFELDEFSKPKKVRKQKTHRQKIYFDDDFDDVKPRKQAGKRRHSRNINNSDEQDLYDDDVEQYKHLLR